MGSLSPHEQTRGGGGCNNMFVQGSNRSHASVICLGLGREETAVAFGGRGLLTSYRAGM